MAYQPHTLLTFGGSLGSSPDKESWQCGVRVLQDTTGAGNGPGQVSDLPGYLTAITGGLMSWWKSAASSSLDGYPPTYATLEWAKVSNIAATGLVAGTPSQTTWTSANSGTYTGTTPPWFCTMAISWRSAIGRGPGSNGRIYPPLGLNATSGVPKTTGTAPNNALTFGKLLLTNISKPTSAFGQTGAVRPYIVSKSGVIAAITAVRVGSVIDVQRRRKKSLTEAYVTSAWS